MKKSQFLISYSHKGHWKLNDGKYFKKHSFWLYKMVLYLSLNMGVFNVLDIPFWKSSKSHSEDVTQGSWEAAQHLTLCFHWLEIWSIVWQSYVPTGPSSAT
jgi:hypothetical protein